MATTITPTPDEQNWFGIFRIGIWPDYFPGVQFAKDSETLNQYFRQITPDTGPFDIEQFSDVGSELFNKIEVGYKGTPTLEPLLKNIAALKEFYELNALEVSNEGWQSAIPDDAVPEVTLDTSTDKETLSTVMASLKENQKFLFH